MGEINLEGWVEVNDRLPGQGFEVIVQFWWKAWAYVRLHEDEYGDVYWIDDRGARYEIDETTHWKPVPWNGN